MQSIKIWAAFVQNKTVKIWVAFVQNKTAKKLKQKMFIQIKKA